MSAFFHTLTENYKELSYNKKSLVSHINIILIVAYVLK